MKRNEAIRPPKIVISNPLAIAASTLLEEKN